MDKKDSTLLEAYDIHGKDDYYQEGFSRNIGLLTHLEQDRLKNARIAIPGLGGVGGIHLITMIRSGIGRFNLADFDVFEPANLNRQYGASMNAFGRKKLEVMKQTALSINPFLEINEFPDGITPENIDRFLEGVDVVLDGLDFFEFEIRRYLFKKAAEKGIWVITAGPMGFSSAMLVFDPNGMGFDAYFNIKDQMTDKDKYLSFAIGLAPRPTHIKYMDLKRVDLDAKAGPSLNIACQLCSGFAATECLKILLNKGNVRSVPCYIQYDPFLQKLRKGRLFLGNRNPVQLIKKAVIKKILKKNKLRVGPEPEMPARPASFASGIPLKIVRYIATVGSLAPSADNIQPIRFKWEDETLFLLKDTDKTGFFYDVNQESTFLTAGAVIENVAIAASAYGLSVKDNLLPEGKDSDLLAKISFSYAKINRDPLFTSVTSRCVNRSFYNKVPIRPQVAEELKKVCDRSDDTQLVWIHTHEDKQKLRNIVFNADRILFEDSRLHQGLFRWINLVPGKKKTGMDIDILGLNPFQKLIFPLMADWNKMKAFNRFGASRMAAFNSVQLLKSAQAYALIMLNENQPENYISGGRIMERFWIQANAMGLSVQPMAGFVFLLNHLSADDASQFTPEHRNLIKKMKKDMAQLKGVETRKSCLMFFRIGYADKYTQKPPREVIRI